VKFFVCDALGGLLMFLLASALRWLLRKRFGFFDFSLASALCLRASRGVSEFLCARQIKACHLAGSSIAFYK
jgi:hypothetical protein